MPALNNDKILIMIYLLLLLLLHL